MADNMLFFGDNLDVLRQLIDDESVDLIYLYPPMARRAHRGMQSRATLLRL
jgi:hypothetical protein